MNPKFALRDMWELLKPFRDDIAKSYPEIKRVTAVQFRGHNPKSPNSPKRGGMTLWVNNNGSQELTSANTTLLKRHEKLLKTVWAQMLDKISDHTDRVMIAVQGGEVYVPGIYPSHTDTNVSLPYYQPSNDKL